MSRSEIKRHTRDKLLELWRDEWANSDKGRTTFKFIPNPSITKELQWFQPTLEQLFIITGHGTLNKYLKDRTIAECSCGYPEEDWSHVLLYCPLYNDVRSWDDNLRHNLINFWKTRLSMKNFLHFVSVSSAGRRKPL